MKLFKNVRAYENAHIALWLIKDTSWVMGWRPLGVAMIVPTLVVAIDIAWRSRKSLHDLFHNIAVCCWITANAVWMTGEFYANDTWRPYARIFFGIGMVTLLYYYAFLFRKHADAEE